MFFPFFRLLLNGYVLDLYFIYFFFLFRSVFIVNTLLCVHSTLCVPTKITIYDATGSISRAKKNMYKKQNANYFMVARLCQKFNSLSPSPSLPRKCFFFIASAYAKIVSRCFSEAKDEQRMNVFFFFFFRTILVLLARRPLVSVRHIDNQSCHQLHNCEHKKC